MKAIERPTPRQTADDAISTKICTGCQRDPASTGALPASTATNGATDKRDVKRDVKLEELHALTPPQMQSDLNTFDLASAHRERAKSMEQKTDGLWQSWLVSVCEGCGDQKPAKALRYEEWPYRESPGTTGTIEKARPVAETKAPPQPRGTIEADLSPENVDSIRRMPQR